MNESNFMRLWGPSKVETADVGEKVVEFSSGTRCARPSEPVFGGQTKWSVPPLAKMTALDERAHLQESDLPSEAVCLSRFAYLRPLGGALVLESPLSQFRITLTDPRTGNLLLELGEPRLLKTLGEVAGLPAGLVREFMQLLWGGRFLAAGPEPPELRMWDFHNLVFHGRKRWHDSALAPANRRKGNAGTCPVVKLPMRTNGQLLPVPSLDSAAGSGPTLTGVMETRHSIRSFDDVHPITLEQLGELLYRAGRVKSIFKSKDKFGHLGNSDSSDRETMLSERPYPGGGARYELELYPIVRHCAGLDGGLYHYDPLNHRLEKLKDGQDEDVLALIEDAFGATGRQGMPQVLLVIAARFGRMFEAYQSVGYSLILKNVGVLFQNLYLVATAMKLAPCALGDGDVERFGCATGLEFLDETMVGGFIVGTAPDESSEVAPAGSGRPSIAETDPETAAAGAVLPAALLPTDAKLATPSRHPHDLDDQLPGLSTLRDKTLGDSRVTVVILDGDPDLTLSCFRGGHVAKKYPFWHERAEPITAEQHALYREISERDLKREETQEELAAAFSPPVLNRIMGDRHATHVTSTVAGRPGSPAPGIAPECRVIVVPLNELGDPGEIMSALNLARGFSLAYELGADIIHCAICVPTQTDQPHDLLARAVKTCLDDDILIVAPVGNDGGDCRCIPAVLPGTLAVGALKDDGQPFKFTNWGGNYSTDGIMGPGERILCAQPRTEQPTRQKGTSLAAPVVTGVAALLMSQQLRVGRQIDAKAIRKALLSTARACDSAVVEEPDRCLRGVIDLPAAMDVLFGSPGFIGASSKLAPLFEDGAIAPQSGTPRNSSVDATLNTDSEAAVSPVASAADTEAVHPSGAETVVASASVAPGADSIKQSTAHSGLVYALGRLSFDLASEIGKQSLEQRMAQGVKDGELRGANPNEPRDLIEYLDKNPTERRCIIWTLEMDGAPIYALEPKGPYADEIYEHLLCLLAGQILPEHAAEFIEQVSIPARRTGRVVDLLSRAKIPGIALTNVRGIHGWPINALVSDALASAIPSGSSIQDDETLRNALVNFLKRVYFDLHNYGLTSRDRAMNYAATNCCQAASVFIKALAEGRVLRTITVDKSPVCRMHSDCWEIYLTFDDPDNVKRATRVFHFTVDVSDMMPVTVGAVKSWTRMPFQ
jgi:cyanobactin maturation PatA/PatG family protease